MLPGDNHGGVGAEKQVVDTGLMRDGCRICEAGK